MEVDGPAAKPQRGPASIYREVTGGAGARATDWAAWRGCRTAPRLARWGVATPATSTSAQVPWHA